MHPEHFRTIDKILQSYLAGGPEPDLAETEVVEWEKERQRRAIRDDILQRRSDREREEHEVAEQRRGLARITASLNHD